MAETKLPITKAEVRLPSTDLSADIRFWTKVLGFRMDTIYPADDPRVAVFSGHGLRIRVEKGAGEPPGTVRILTEDPGAFDGPLLTAPGGTRVEIDALNPPFVLPETEHAFVVRRLADQAPWVIGRAGMHYRDLIPSRLGGSIIASHIRIPDGGPVPDMVHYHTVGFQLIFCYRGWVDLVYEDQGPPFRLEAGNCVIQPPEIRHRVLFASDNIEVIEIGVPAEHVTTIDHEMELPNGSGRPGTAVPGAAVRAPQGVGSGLGAVPAPGVHVARHDDFGEHRRCGGRARGSPWRRGASVVRAPRRYSVHLRDGGPDDARGRGEGPVRP